MEGGEDAGLATWRLEGWATPLLPRCTTREGGSCPRVVVRGGLVGTRCDVASRGEVGDAGTLVWVGGCGCGWRGEAKGDILFVAVCGLRGGDGNGCPRGRRFSGCELHIGASSGEREPGMGPCV